jgi:hypothetical protein
MKPTGGILVRPVDKKENYIKRCVAVAGDSWKCVNGMLVFVNGQEPAVECHWPVRLRVPVLKNASTRSAEGAVSTSARMTSDNGTAWCHPLDR